MSNVVPFKRPDGREPMSAYEKLMMDRRLEEINATKPISKWLQGFRDAVKDRPGFSQAKKDDGAA